MSRRSGWDRSLGQKLPRSLDTHLDQILVWRQAGRALCGMRE